MPAWAGGWDGQFGQPYSLLNTRDDTKRIIAMAFERRGARDLSALAIALNGVAPGANATATYKLVEAQRGVTGFDLGGIRQVLTQTLINRNTTAADQTLLNSLYDGVFAPTSYPADKGGGGGGKLNSLM